MIEAILATCATQPDFESLPSGSSFDKRDYIAASGATNPIHEVITEAHLLFGGNANVVALLSLGTGNPGISSLPLSGRVTVSHRATRDTMHDCEQKAQEFGERLGRIGIYYRFSVDQGMQDDQAGRINDPEWITAQTDDYLNRHEICEKLDLFVQGSGVGTGPITLDQLSASSG